MKGFCILLVSWICHCLLAEKDKSGCFSVFMTVNKHSWQNEMRKENTLISQSTLSSTLAISQLFFQYSNSYNHYASYHVVLWPVNHDVSLSRTLQQLFCTGSSVGHDNVHDISPLRLSASTSFTCKIKPK